MDSCMIFKIDAADALLDGRRAPRQVVEHNLVTELEVATFAAGLGRQHDLRPVRIAEPRDLSILIARRQRPVKDGDVPTQHRRQCGV
jgi:hypothetical protein